MYSDPMSITVSGNAKSLARTNSTSTGGAFATSDRAYQVTVSHSYGRRNRHLFRLQFDSLVADPLISGQNIPQSMSAHLVVDTPSGYDTTTAKAVADALLAYLAASSGAAITKLLGGES